tara:strand:+ start:29 stop:499 length:471 start_codon:yes stop_codon:yes gene_type:complete
MHHYENTQPGTFIRVMTGSWVVLFGVLVVVMLALGQKEAAIILGVVTVGLALILGIVLVLCHSLTVRVSRSEIALSFGVGLIRKQFLIGDISSASIVQNRWYNGFGIRKIRGGWLYNVSGFDAIEIQLKNERKYRIGTNQPKELLAAVESALASFN